MNIEELKQSKNNITTKKDNKKNIIIKLLIKITH